MRSLEKIYYFVILNAKIITVDGCFVKWGSKIDKVAFYDVKLLNFKHYLC